VTSINIFTKNFYITQSLITQGMLKKNCGLNGSLFLTLFSLFSLLTVVPVSSQAEPFDDANVAVTGNYVNVDDALEILPAIVLSPIKQNDVFLFSDIVEDHLVSLDTPVGDPRPTVHETSEYMIGKAGVYIIFVESNGELDPNLYDWSETSIAWAKNGIYRALYWWKSQYPFRNPKLEFYVNTETIIGYTMYEPMIRPRDDYKLWVPDVLKRLGCGEGNDYYEIGKSCAHTIRQYWQMDWAFIIFVVNSGTGYPGWSSTRAYALIGGPYLVLPFGWFYHMMFEGTDELSKVVAHEIGHIFGATDEYDNKPKQSGYLYEFDNDGSGCIMDSLSRSRWCISRGTMRQIGWVDDNYNGYPDVLENRPSIILWNSISPITDSEEIVIEGVFRLEPYPCRRPNCRPVTINRVVPVYATGVLMALEGPFDTAYEPFRLIYRPNMPGYHLISIAITDAVMGNVESYNKTVLYTYMEVQSIETPLTIGRVDVGVQVPIRFKVVLAHDKKPVQFGRFYVGGFQAKSLGDGWFEVIASSSSVGRFLYQPTSAEVLINTDVGSGRLTKIKLLDGVKPLEIIYDKVVILLKAMKKRVDVGTEAPINIDAKYAFDSTPFIGKVYLSTDKKQDKVGLYYYFVTRIEDELYGLKVFETNELQVIFDTVIIELKSSNERIEAGKQAEIFYEAYYAYDNSPFEGEIFLNNDLKIYDVRQVIYTVSRITDHKYGLKSFKSNSVTITFDKIQTLIDINTILPFTVKVTIKTYYESDRSPVASGVLIVSSNNLYYSEKDYPGTYLINYLEVLPVTWLAGEFVVEGFDEIKIVKNAIHLGNVVLYLLITVVLIFLIQKMSASKRVKKLECPRCRSTNYIGVKVASNMWEYECLSCGKRWHMLFR